MFKSVDGSLYFNGNKIIRFICCARKRYKNEKINNIILNDNILFVNNVPIFYAEYGERGLSTIYFDEINYNYDYYIKNRLNLLYNISSRIDTSKINSELIQTYTWSGHKKVSGGIYQLKNKKYKPKDNMFRLFCTFRGVRHVEEFKCLSTKWEDVSQGIVDYFKKVDKQLLSEFYKDCLNEYNEIIKLKNTNISYNKPV